jgi:hypothetical protein
MADTKDTAVHSGPVLSWRWLSIALATMTLSLIATLAVVAWKQNADALSTTALVLAVLSFVAQIVLSFAQAYSENRQIVEIDKVNSDTRATLAAIAATSSALLSNQRGQFSEVLQAALTVVSRQASRNIMEDGSSDGGADLLAMPGSVESGPIFGSNSSLKSDRGKEVPVTQGTGNKSETVRPDKRMNADALYFRLAQYPSQARGEEILPILNGLTSKNAIVFSRVATLLSERARRGDGPRLSIAIQGRQNTSLSELQATGLITVIKIADDVANGARTFWVELTDVGIDVARLFLGQGSVPTWLLCAY